MKKFHIWFIFSLLHFIYSDSSNGQAGHYNIIYTSHDLSGHLVAAECNPGGTTSCPCSEADVAISSNGDYGCVTSNVREINTYVNAIGYKKFLETFPNKDSIALGVYKYVGYVKLPILPLADTSQRQNPQSVHFMIQAWFGRSTLFTSHDSSYEGTIYWELNPWIKPSGKIKIYVDSLIETGIILTPDTLWHRFEIVVDLSTRKYVSIAIDSISLKLDDPSHDYSLHRVYHSDWGTDISINITTESLAAWPQSDCSNIFIWTTYFRDLEFYKFSPLSTEVNNQIWIPNVITLTQNFPNPFNPSTTFSFNMHSKSHISLKVFDLLGREVATIVSEEMSAGNHTRQWNAIGMPSGIYYFRLQAGMFSKTMKLVLLR